MGRTVYLSIHEWLFLVVKCGVHVGKYNVRPMDASWDLFVSNYNGSRPGSQLQMTRKPFQVFKLQELYQAYHGFLVGILTVGFLGI